MNPKVLTDTRGIKPSISLPCHVQNYFLSLGIGGRPYFEPAFASIHRFDPPEKLTREYALKIHEHCKFGTEFTWDPEKPEASLPPTLHGVIHRITKAEYQKMLLTEGVWGYKEVYGGYTEIEVECKTYNGDVFLANTLISKQETVLKRAQISQRYLGIIREGASQSKLDPAYQQYLQTLEPFHVTTNRKKIGQVVFGTLFLLPSLIIFVLMYYLLKTGKPLPRWGAIYISYTMRYERVLHEGLFERVFGSGNNNYD